MGLAPDGRGAFQMPQQERSVRAARQGRLAPPRGTSRACARHLFPNVERRASNVARKRRRTDETGKTDGNGPSDGRGGVRSRCRNGGETVTLPGTIAITGIASQSGGASSPSAPCTRHAPSRQRRARSARPIGALHGSMGTAFACPSPGSPGTARPTTVGPANFFRTQLCGKLLTGGTCRPRVPENRKTGKSPNRRSLAPLPPNS